MDPLVGYRSVPAPSPALEAASDDAGILRDGAALIEAALKFLTSHQVVTWHADNAISDVYCALEDAAAKLHGAADDVISDAGED